MDKLLEMEPWTPLHHCCYPDLIMLKKNSGVHCCFNKDLNEGNSGLHKVILP